MMMVSQTIVPKPSICAPSWILTASPSLSVTEASASSDLSGVYGVTKADGETVVGWEIPREVRQVRGTGIVEESTFQDLLSAIDLGNLLVQKLVTLLADVDDLLASNTEGSNSLENLLGDLSGALVLGKGIWVGKSVIYADKYQQTHFAGPQPRRRAESADLKLIAGS